MGDGADVIRINLGCGNKLFPGFINVDVADNYSGKAPDVIADVFGVLPFPDNYADEVHAIHIIEHCYVWETPAVLNEWKRVLKPGGLLVLELPCLEKILYFFTQPPIGYGKTLWGLYGDPSHRDPKMCHRWAYSIPMMIEMLEMVELEDIKHLEPLFHMPKRDMRFEARKPHAD